MDTNDLANQATETTNRIKEAASEWTGKAKGTVRDAGAAADLYLHEYAWTSMATVAILAGTIGYLLGCSGRRR